MNENEKALDRKLDKKKIIAGAMAAVTLTGGISAFFTDTNTVDNKFTVGKVTSKLTEEEYDRLGEAQRNGLTPNKEVIKDPVVQNVDEVDMVTFLKVEIPMANVKVYDGDKVSESAERELFTFAANNGWTLVSKTKGTGTMDYYYAYGTDSKMTVLKSQDKTSVLFKDSKIKLINLVNGTGLPEGLSVKVTDYSIQANDLGKEKPLDILNIILKQSGFSAVEGVVPAAPVYKQGQLVKLGTLSVDGKEQSLPAESTNAIRSNTGNIVFKDTVEGKELQWRYAEVDGKKYLVCDRNIVRGISWDTLNAAGFVKGKTLTIDGKQYKCRLMTGGTTSEDKNNEWDKIINGNIGGIGNSNDIWHWDGVYSWCQEDPDNDGYKVIRGFSSASTCLNHSSSNYNVNVGFRPVLEVIE